MWINKILLVISTATAIVIRAEINGLQNDLQNGYSYERPAPIPAELAFYINIPAGHNSASQNQQFNQGRSAASSVENNHVHGQTSFNLQSLDDLLPQIIARNQQQFNEPANRYIPPTPIHDLPFIQENRAFRPFNPPHQQQSLPFIQENTGLRLIGDPRQFSSNQYQHSSTPLQQQNSQYQVESRNQKQVPFRFPGTQNTPAPSQELRPPPSLNTHKPSASHPTPNHNFMASLSSSYNAPLPFPFGFVPIKFDPLPLKTHLRQEKLLPISSYDVLKK